VPADVLTQYQGLGGLRILEKIIPREELDREFQSADIVIAPFHHTSPLILLDAMSYGLPVVTIDAWANPQYVVHGETGLVARRSKKLSYYYADTHQPNSGTPGFIKAIRTPDPEVVTELASMVGLLIENPELRRKLGKAARHEVEAGKFSLAVMNRTLSRIFSEAVSAAE
jgi:glycosyltransferase involved in cell wall biosynthesis